MSAYRTMISNRYVHMMKFVIPLLLITAFVVSCLARKIVPIPLYPTIATSPSPTLTVTRTPLPTNHIFPTRIPSGTADPGWKTSASKTTTVTPTRERSRTFTPFPTFSMQERENAILELLRTNGNCTTLCFWGITPGLTTLVESLQIFKPLSELELTTTESNGTHYYYASLSAREDHLWIAPGIIEKNGGIVGVVVSIGGFYYPEVKRSDWESYSLRNILDTYGVPTKVFFSKSYPHEWPITNQVFLSYWVYYENHQLLIYYPVGGIIEEGIVYPFCPLSPAYDPDYLYLWIGKIPHQYTTFSDGSDFEQITGMSNQDFYESFTDGNTNKCMYLAAEKIPGK